MSLNLWLFTDVRPRADGYQKPLQNKAHIHHSSIPLLTGDDVFNLSAGTILKNYRAAGAGEGVQVLVQDSVHLVWSSSSGPEAQLVSPPRPGMVSATAVALRLRRRHTLEELMNILTASSNLRSKNRFPLRRRFRASVLGQHVIYLHFTIFVFLHRAAAPP